MDLIVRKHVYNCSRIFTAQLITYCTLYVGVRTCTLFRVYIYGREYRMRRNRNGRKMSSCDQANRLQKLGFGLEK